MFDADEWEDDWDVPEYGGPSLREAYLGSHRFIKELSTEDVIDFFSEPGLEPSWERQLFMIRVAIGPPDDTKPYDWNEDFDRR